MPIYEYRCQSCSQKFELFQPVGANNQGLTCPFCGAPKPERIFSLFGANGVNASYSSATGCNSKSPFS